MAYLYGTPQYAAITAATATVGAGDLDKTFYVTPHSGGSTTITLPAAAASGKTVRFFCDSVTAVDRYVDITITGSETFKAPFSAAAKNIRLWKPSTVTFLDDGSGWIAVDGSCFTQMPWLIGDTEGTLGHGLFDVIPFGRISGAGVRGLIRGTAFHALHVYSSWDASSLKLTDWVVEQHVDSGDPIWFGSTLTRSADRQAMVSYNGPELVPAGTSPQFLVLNFHSGANWDSAEHYDNIYSNESTGSTPLRSFNLSHNGGAGSRDEMIIQWHTDGSNRSSDVISLADSTDYTIITGWDGGSGAEAGYAGINDGSLAAMGEVGSFTETEDVDSHPICVFASKARWEAGSAPTLPIKINSVFHYHDRVRWSDAEIDAFYACRTGSDGRVLL